MVTYSAWLLGNHPTSQTRTIREQKRAAHAWKRINEKPTSVAFRPPTGATLAAQTVRIEVDNRSNLETSPAGAAAKMHLIVYGVRNHATVTNTNMAEGYRFVLNGDEYRCIDIILTLGEIQGIFEAIG